VSEPILELFSFYLISFSQFPYLVLSCCVAPLWYLCLCRACEFSRNWY